MIFMTDSVKEKIKSGELPQITEENYYSDEINKAYMSFHTWLSLHGSLGCPACEAKAMAELNGEYGSEEKSDAFLIGGYVDACLTGTKGEFERFKKEHPEMYSTRGESKGQLKSTYKIADIMIDRCKKDKLFMAFIGGEHQDIFCAELFGCVWKCKLDSYTPHKAIVDLKTTREMHKQFYVPDFGHIDFISYYSYHHQLAIYRAIVKACMGEELPCFICPVSKSEHPEIKIVHVDDVTLFDAITEVKNSCENTELLSVWRGETEPLRCGRPDCDYCVDTEVLTAPINYKDLIAGD